MNFVRLQGIPVLRVLACSLLMKTPLAPSMLLLFSIELPASKSIYYEHDLAHGISYKKMEMVGVLEHFILVLMRTTDGGIRKDHFCPSKEAHSRLFGTFSCLLIPLSDNYTNQWDFVVIIIAFLGAYSRYL